MSSCGIFGDLGASTRHFRLSSVRPSLVLNPHQRLLGLSHMERVDIGNTFGTSLSLLSETRPVDVFCRRRIYRIECHASVRSISSNMPLHVTMYLCRLYGITTLQVSTPTDIPPCSNNHTGFISRRPTCILYITQRIQLLRRHWCVSFLQNDRFLTMPMLNFKL